jgi:uncharacterized membrane protein YkoI
MNKIALLVLVLVVAGLGYAVYHEDSDYGLRPNVSDIDNHNVQMNECIKIALEKHPGAILEVEVEMEDGQMITDVDIQGRDGKSWEVECELATGKIIEDKQEH